MEKFVNLIIQSVAYFGIVLLIFFISRKLGINSDSSIWSLAIGSTIGWIIVQGISTIKKKKKYNK
ncbi:hypothetical protein CFOLD11_24400 [Clostridium folliculivorans]|uniref:Uncharacterized protein n=1 Tax=Clostridium folliculivorans TaxID=2886038 RepID=A0A9W5Y2M9_9CLOT|nr:hypothetical protein [Clostridium folliculivorans]GKU25614.1 hypothetical protein CFOLD11_24400 [Clostridium folliculivorans]